MCQVVEARSNGTYESVRLDSSINAFGYVQSAQKKKLHNLSSPLRRERASLGRRKYACPYLFLLAIVDLVVPKQSLTTTLARLF